jgi:hypothetical protein
MEEYASILTRLELGLLTHPPVAMAFTDASGRHWYRDGYGILKELSEPVDDDYLRRTAAGGRLDGPC